MIGLSHNVTCKISIPRYNIPAKGIAWAALFKSINLLLPKITRVFILHRFIMKLVKSTGVACGALLEVPTIGICRLKWFG